MNDVDVLARRARILAGRQPEKLGLDAASTAVLTIRLNEERFALAVNAVAQVIPLGKLTSVPGAPPELVGVTAIKGEVLAVFDLARVLGLAGRDEPPAGYVLILKHADARVGLLVSGVDQIAAGEPDGQVIGPTQSRRLIRIGDDRLVLIEELERTLAPHIHGDGQ